MSSLAIRLLVLAALVLNGPGAGWASAAHFDVMQPEVAPLVTAGKSTGSEHCVSAGQGQRLGSSADSGSDAPASSHSHCGGSVCQCGCAAPAAAPLPIVITGTAGAFAQPNGVRQIRVQLIRTTPPLRPPSR